MTSHAERIDRVSRVCSLNRVFVSGEDAAALADLFRLRGAIVEESRASTIAEVIDDLRAASTWSHSRSSVSAHQSRPPGRPASVCCLVAQPRPPTCESRRARTRVIWKPLEVGRGGSVTQWHQASAGIPVSRISWHTSSSLARHDTLATDRSGTQRSESPLDELRQITADADAAIWRYARAAHFVRRHDSVWTLTVVSAPVRGCRTRSAR